jgi:hypothetical protein
MRYVKSLDGLLEFERPLHHFSNAVRKCPFYGDTSAENISVADRKPTSGGRVAVRTATPGTSVGLCAPWLQRDQAPQQIIQQNCVCHTQALA